MTRRRDIRDISGRHRCYPDPGRPMTIPFPHDCQAVIRFQNVFDEDDKKRHHLSLLSLSISSRTLCVEHVSIYIAQNRRKSKWKPER